MPTFDTPHQSTGATTLTLSLDGVSSTYTITNIAIAFTNPNANAEQIDVAHLGQTTGEQAARMDRPLIVPATDGAASGRQFTFDYIGKVVISDAATGTYKITVGGVNLLGGTTASYHTVTSSSLTLATNDVIRGQAVLTIAR
jgi:hypothetical protein